MRFSLFLISAVFFLSTAALAHAQFSAAPDPVQYIVAPEAPGPNSLVLIEAQGVGPFIGNATITWQVNGKTVQSGVGLTNFSLTTGGVGSATRVHVSIDSSQGTYVHDWIFAPSVVDLVWEANTSAPLFFLGKPLYSAGSKMKVVAFPTIISGHSIVSSSAISFQWSRGGNIDPAASGLGKNVFVFDGDQIQSSENVSVDLYIGTNKVGHADLYIPSTNPGLVLYDQDPLRGELLDTALPGTFNLDASEVTLHAEPYYFANSSVARGALSYSWTLNSADTQGPDSARGLLTLRQTGQGSGAANVTVAAQNTDTDKFTQAAQTSVNIIFGQSGSSLFTSLFGL